MNFNLQDLYNRIYQWILQYGPGIVLAIIVFVLGIILVRLFNKWLRRVFERRKLNPSVRYFLQNLIVILLEVMLTVICLQIAGLKLTVFSAIMAGLTVAAGLALSGTLNNFVSGVLILFLKPYRVGDNITAQGNDGTVTSIQLFYTVVLTFDNRTLILPNGQLSNSVVINLSREGKRRLDIDIKFGYNTDYEAVKAVIKKTLEDADHILPEPAYRIGISNLDNDRFVVTTNVWIEAHGFEDKKLALNEAIMKNLKDNGIKFPGMS